MSLIQVSSATMAFATAGTLRQTIHCFRMSLCLHVVAAVSQDVQASFYPWSFTIFLDAPVVAFPSPPQQWLWYPPVRTRGRPGANLFPPGSLQISIAEIPPFTTGHSGQQLAPRSLALPTTHTRIVAGLVPHPDLTIRLSKLYPIDPRLYGNEDAAFITTLAWLNLILRFRVPLAPDGTEDKELVFYSELHTALMKHLADHHLSLSEKRPASAPDRPMPAATDSAGLNTWHVLHLLDYLWTALAVGIKPRPGFRRKLSSAPIAWYDFKISALKVETVWSSLSDTVNPGGAFYFISFKHYPLEGPLPHQSPIIAHKWFPLHLQHALGDLDDEFFRCLPTCPSGDTPSNVTTTLASGHSELFILDGAINSDQEEDQVQQAVAHSIADAASGSTSTPGAGPSRPSCPLPPPPMAGIHPRSLSHTPPPSMRRRLNPIDLTASPPPAGRGVVPVVYGSLMSWIIDMRTNLSRTHFAVTAPTVDDAVHTLLQHFESFFGDPPYVPENKTNKVIIEQLGQFGLFAKDGSWKSGGSIGEGVGRTT
ncbi:hypothetical protein B0H10DRAFT_2210211 [Mycena sp. CBHHK59/15]|nr:hypothetical protein B0H10DRAFT_2210211 [Mycena sp. CBHHK59/15]